jgi:hypothetical protein
VNWKHALARKYRKAACASDSRRRWLSRHRVSATLLETLRAIGIQRQVNVVSQTYGAKRSCNGALSSGNSIFNLAGLEDQRG